MNIQLPYAPRCDQFARSHCIILSLPCGGKSVAVYTNKQRLEQRYCVVELDTHKNSRYSKSPYCFTSTKITTF